jgi:hypothetical protein
MKHSTSWKANSLSAGQELRGKNTDTGRERIQFCKRGNEDSDTKMGHKATRIVIPRWGTRQRGQWYQDGAQGNEDSDTKMGHNHTAS